MSICENKLKYTVNMHIPICQLHTSHILYLKGVEPVCSPTEYHSHFLTKTKNENIFSQHSASKPKGSLFVGLHPLPKSGAENIQENQNIDHAGTPCSIRFMPFQAVCCSLLTQLSQNICPNIRPRSLPFSRIIVYLIWMFHR